jgi:hypothetical protein
MNQFDFILYEHNELVIPHVAQDKFIFLEFMIPQYLCDLIAEDDMASDEEKKARIAELRLVEQRAAVERSRLEEEMRPRDVRKYNCSSCGKTLEIDLMNCGANYGWAKYQFEHGTSFKICYACSNWDGYWSD